jgi:hypothetical protein
LRGQSSILLYYETPAFDIGEQQSRPGGRWISVTIQSILSHQLRLISLFGRKRHIAAGDLINLGGHANTLFFLAVTITALTLLNANGYQENLSLVATGFVWVVGVATVTLSYMALVFIWAMINAKTGYKTVFMPVIGGLSTFTTLLATELTVWKLAGTPLTTARYFSHFPLTFLVIEVFDLMYFTYAMPVIQAQKAVEKPKPEPVAAARIRLAGRSFDPASIRYARSQDHYLCISFGNGEEMILARMADLVNQMPYAAGIQTHRSWWVSAGAFARIEKQDKADMVILDAGEKIPMAQKRIAEVRAWLDALGLDDEAQ